MKFSPWLQSRAANSEKRDAFEVQGGGGLSNLPTIWSFLDGNSHSNESDDPRKTEPVRLGANGGLAYKCWDGILSLRSRSHPSSAGQIVIDESRPAISATNKAILFGDLKQGYMARKVGSFGIKRLSELLALKNETGFVLFCRVGGYHTDAGTHPIRSLTQHA